MNFLGHLYFSNNDHSLMYANLFGDFVKGSQLDHFSPTIQKGIQLHRSIDQFIDHHPAVVELRRSLSASLPKVSSIAIDLYFDHLLSKNWNDFHILEYQQFLQEFYNFNIDASDNYSSHFLDFRGKLIEHNWMSHYPTKFGLEKLCKGVGSRLSFKNSLEIAHLVFENQEEEIQASFHHFMNDAIPHFHGIHRNS
ncbi:MAG: ACP phosphodiesterase [Bacteroidota bacterium]